MKFHKTLAKYYEHWHRTSYESAIYCQANNMPEKAKAYLKYHQECFDLINEYWDEITFFKIGHNAHYIPSYTELKWKEFLAESKE